MHLYIMPGTFEEVKTNHWKAEVCIGVVQFTVQLRLKGASYSLDVPKDYPTGDVAAEATLAEFLLHTNPGTKVTKFVKEDQADENAENVTIELMAGTFSKVTRKQWKAEFRFGFTQYEVGLRKSKAGYEIDIAESCPSDIHATAAILHGFADYLKPGTDFKDFLKKGETVSVHQSQAKSHHIKKDDVKIAPGTLEKFEGAHWQAQVRVGLKEFHAGFHFDGNRFGIWPSAGFPDSQLILAFTVSAFIDAIGPDTDLPKLPWKKDKHDVADEEFAALVGEVYQS